MNVRKIAQKAISTALITPVLLGGFFAQASKAEWVKSLPAGGEDWVSYDLSRGDYLFEASTLWSLGDVDIEVYDSSNNLIGRANTLGTDRIRLSAAYRDTFYVKYKMPFCVNPVGDCAVNISVFNL